ncbi:type I-E CRISPR-associated protein Cas7/Cse4/CasC [Lactobacillus corticis]|uniref:CRISPR-associated protein n=1 Tax=Lactobacillus corticis TaxID=2201249 RepID=A0A916QIM5_9LACO|nr:type I-E CRISPR-associated protein Cas7/Cse4/CasC [Lactobacillus corticis]GFZ26133.1 CRISPR-associated protein [Lactobacillus corticis]
MKNVYLDLHVLQTVPSSNINRDDAGSPKTAIYGGKVRSRVSSQSWKRAIRQGFKHESDGADWLDAYRTKRAVELLAKEIQKADSSLADDAALEKSIEIFTTAGIKLDSKTNETKALLFVSKGQLVKLAQYALEHEEDLAEKDDKKKAKEVKNRLKAVLNSDQSLDLALFGRMVADDPSLNVDASAQVAHAISTNAITPEYDYFTGLDDCQNDDEAGSAMIGTIEYNSSTLYRYANINLHDLQKNVGKDLTIEGLKLFIKEFVLSMPDGKQNTFANKTVPQYVMATIRTDTPVNLVSAFEDPVKGKNGYVAESIEKLENEYNETMKFVDQPVKTVVLTTKDSKMSDLAENLTDLINQTAGAVEETLNNENDHD